MVVVLALLGIVVVVGLVAFSRAVFGGSGLPRERRRKGDDEDTHHRGPRPDAHPGAGRWTGGGGLGTWGTWSGGDGGSSDG